MSSQQAPIFDTGWQGFPLTGSCQIPRRSANDQGQEETLISVRPGGLPLATLRDGLIWGG